MKKVTDLLTEMDFVVIKYRGDRFFAIKRVTCNLSFSVRRDKRGYMCEYYGHESLAAVGNDHYDSFRRMLTKNLKMAYKLAYGRDGYVSDCMMLISDELSRLAYYAMGEMK